MLHKHLKVHILQTHPAQHTVFQAKAQAN